jgi:glyoxylase-like metal-dependent hydrolase (beta-lactamase superfamily II)
LLGREVGQHFLGVAVRLHGFPDVLNLAVRQDVECGARCSLVSSPTRSCWPTPLETDHFELKGLPLQVIETGHTDGTDTSALYVPDLGLIASGDAVYNRCHMYVGDTTAASRAEWIAAIDQLAALHPTSVVTGHKDPTCGNPPAVLDESRGYLEAYGQLREAGLPDQELFEAMVSCYPDWVSCQQWLLLGFPS